MTPPHTSNRTKQLFALGVLATLLILACVGISILASQWVMQESHDWSQHDQAHGHHWLHKELGLTAKESMAIDAFEDDYREKKEALTQQFDAHVAELRELLVEQDQYAPEINAAIHRLHQIHGALQELSIRHYYDMMSVLPPGKQDKLRQLAVKALSQPE